MLSRASFRPSRIHLPALPSLGAALLSALLAARHRCGTMRALTPAVPRQHARSACLPGIQPPTTSCVRTSRSYHLVRRSVPSGSSASPNPRELATTRRRIGFVILQATRSLPAAPHPASERRHDRIPRTTQLLSATCAVTAHGMDSHHADKTDSRTHEGRRLAAPALGARDAHPPARETRALHPVTVVFRACASGRP